MKKREPKQERTESVLYPEQISNLRNIASIRTERHREERNRLADFNERQGETVNTPEKEPLIKGGQRLVINGQEIHSNEDMIAALVDAYGPYPKLYGFEQYAITNDEQEPNDERER